MSGFENLPDINLSYPILAKIVGFLVGMVLVRICFLLIIFFISLDIDTIASPQKSVSLAIRLVIESSVVYICESHVVSISLFCG